MAKMSAGRRSGSGSAKQRSGVAASVRAASRRAERAGKTREDEEPKPVIGPPVVVNDDDPGRPVTVEDRRAAENADLEAPDPAVRRTADAEAAEAADTGQDDGKDTGEGADADEPAGAREDERSPRRIPVLTGRPGPGFLLLTVVTVGALVAAVLLGLEHRETERTAQARTEAAAAARKAAPVILSYDHRHLKKDFAAARDRLTGDFRATYEKTTEKVVTPAATKYKGKVKATVAKPQGSGGSAVSVVSASPEKVVVLVFVNQVTENTELTQPRLDLNRVRMTMVDSDGAWKVGKLEAL